MPAPTKASKEDFATNFFIGVIWILGQLANALLFVLKKLAAKLNEPKNVARIRMYAEKCAKFVIGALVFSLTTIYEKCFKPEEPEVIARVRKTPRPTVEEQFGEQNFRV